MLDTRQIRIVSVANLIATVLVVAIHYNTKIVASEGGIGWNYYIQEFISNGIARVSVPAFAALAGFFLVDKLRFDGGYLHVLKSRFRSLVIPYFIFSISTFLILGGSAFLRSDFTIFEGALRHILLHPLSGQFWFLRDLILLVVLSPFLLGARICWFFVFLFGGVWILNVQIFPVVADWYFLNVESCFFFCLGGWAKYRGGVLGGMLDISKSHFYGLFLLWIAVIGVRIYVDPLLDVWYVDRYTLLSLMLYKAAILIGIVCLFRAAVFFARQEWAFDLSGLTFFVYLFHLFPLSVFTKVTEKVVGAPYGFYVNFPVAVVASFFVADFLFKRFPRVFSLIVGGRTPVRVRSRLAS